MMEKIEKQEIMTLTDAEDREEYLKKWFIFVYTEPMPIDPNEGEGYVAYTFDSEIEMYKAGIGKTLCDVELAYACGVKVESADEIGGIYYD